MERPLRNSSVHLAASLCFRSDYFQKVNKTVLDWRLVDSYEMKKNEVTECKDYQNITLYGGKFQPSEISNVAKY